MEIARRNQAFGEDAPDVLHRIARQLQQCRDDALTLVLRRLTIAGQSGELDRKLHARLRIAGFDNHVEDADIEPRLASHEKSTHKSTAYVKLSGNH